MRRVPLALVLLVLAVIASQFLLWWLQPEAKPRQGAGPPRSAYTLENFSLDVLTTTGKLGVRVQAPHLQRRDGDGSLYIDAPHFILPGSSDSQWLGQSEFGWVSGDGAMLKLQGNVHMQRPATATLGAASIVTADISAWPGEHRLETAAKAKISEPGRILAGTGMKVDMTQHTMELLADVHGTLQPATAP